LTVGGEVRKVKGVQADAEAPADRDSASGGAEVQVLQEDDGYPD